METEEKQKSKTEVKSRSGVDWSKHEFKVNITDNCEVHSLQISNSSYQRIHFINSCGILSIAGDWGNWIFCRGFIPSSEGSSEDYYWCQKLEIASQQKAAAYSPEKTEARLKGEIKKGLAEYGWENDQLKEMKEYYTGLLEHVNDEFWYTYYAVDNQPSFADHDVIIIEKEIHFWLLVVFDAFDEMCRRIKQGEDIKEQINN